MKLFAAVASLILAMLVALALVQSVEIDELRYEMDSLKARPVATHSERVIEKTTEFVDRAQLSRETFIHILKSTARILTTIRTPEGDEMHQGTGVVIYSQKSADPKDTNFYTYVLTCSHVINNGASVVVEQFNYSDERFVTSVVRYTSCEVITNNPRLDIAIIEIKSSNQFPEIASIVMPEDFLGLKLYDPVFACGCPLGSQPFITNGNIASFNSFLGQIQMTAPIYYGNSGGGVFTRDGKLLGLARMIPPIDGSCQPYPNAGLLVPVWAINKFIRDQHLGFAIGAQDGSSIDKLVQARKIAAEKEFKRVMDEFLKSLEPEDPELPSPQLPEKRFR